MWLFSLEASIELSPGAKQYWGHKQVHEQEVPKGMPTRFSSFMVSSSLLVFSLGKGVSPLKTYF